MNEKEQIKDLDNWSNRFTGVYRFILSPGACYEIMIMYHAESTNILTAQASVYISGTWSKENEKESFYQREAILENNTVAECIEAAVKDYEKNIEPNN